MRQHVWSHLFRSGEYLAEVYRLNEDIGTMTVRHVKEEKILIQGGVKLMFDPAIGPSNRDIEGWSAMADFVIGNLKSN